MQTFVKRVESLSLGKCFFFSLFLGCLHETALLSDVAGLKTSVLERPSCTKGELASHIEKQEKKSKCARYADRD